MSKIEGLIVINGINHFPISWLHSKGFCEYQLYLEKIKGIKVEKTMEMIIGKQIHAELEREFLEQAEEEMTIEEALQRSKETGESFLVRELDTISSKYGIYGKIDEVQIFPEKVIVIDDKPGNIAFSGLIKQVAAYSLCFYDQYKPDRDVTIALRNRDTKDVFWSRALDQEIIEEIKKDILEIHDLIRDAREPLSSLNPKKCLSCRFRKVCDRSLA